MIYAQLTWVIVLFALGVSVARWWASRWVKVAAGALTVAAAFTVTADGSALVQHLVALQHAPSVALVLLAVLYCARKFFDAPLTGERDRLLAVVAVTAALFYPPALGVGYADPYALGYHPTFALAAAAVALPLWWFAPARVVAVWLTAALLVHGFGFGESENLWDYLFDPIVFVVAVAWTVRTVAGRLVALVSRLN